MPPEAVIDVNPEPPVTLVPNAVKPPEALDAPGTDAADELAEVAPAVGPPTPWQVKGTDTGVAVTAGMGVVVATVRARPGKAGYVNVLVVVGRGPL